MKKEKIEEKYENKLTVYYKKLSGEISMTISGIQDLSVFPDLEIEEAELIYGYLIVDYNQYLASQFKFYEVITDENGKPKIKLKDGIKQALDL